MKRILGISLLAFVIVAIVGCKPAYTTTNPPHASKGKPQAQVVVDEFADFECPACGQAYNTFKQVQAKYGDRVLWNFYHFPLTSIHPYAFNAAVAAECANDQGKFWEMHDKMYENQTHLGRSDLNQYATDIGLDIEKFKACLGSQGTGGRVRDDLAEGARRGVDSTPSIFVNGVLLPDWGSLDAKLGSFFPSVVNTTTPSSSQQ